MCCDAPCSQPITALRSTCCCEGGPWLVLEVFTEHVEAQVAQTVFVRDVSGRSDHQEPGNTGRQTGHHPRCCPHASGLLHDPRRDSVQHDARRYQNHLRQEVPPAVSDVSSGSYASQTARHPRSHQSTKTQLLRHKPACTDTQHQPQPGHRGELRCPV